MQFLITAYDGKDGEALSRRMSVREEHMVGVKQLIKDGKLLFAAAILNGDGDMIGSSLIIDFPSKEAIYTDWLNDEIYVTGNVWQDIEIKPCKVPDIILDQSWV
jgi:uncharacterized protein YciI